MTDTQARIAKAASKVASIIEEFRKLNAEMQAQQMAIFLAAVAQPGSTITDLANVTGHSTGSVSRNVAALSKTHRKGMPGLDILIANEDVLDRRNKRISLTPKGMRVMASIEALLD
ncbi:MarR family transcriptional regulator [Rhizobium hidalgonense]|uniref:MarR family winged helix-turn-helix transcriptional regulator n=1 Tax=Rhizobium hidalgonense TaxID=1538159 RepID=UPI000FEC8156|nr:MarR family winged helix-turn-helix transcriptional regulator [Rhizobium hidalgonense]RWX10373.1 MarR family transcriptional regulator [Rhizobium hidalgonense]